MKFKGKKGIVFFWIIFFGVIVAVGTFFALSEQSAEKELRENIFFKGKQSIDILNNEIEAQKLVLYIDQSAKFAVKQALKEYEKDKSKPIDYYIDKNLNPYLQAAELPINNYDYLILENSIVGKSKSSKPFYSPLPARKEYYLDLSFNIPTNNLK